MSFQILFRRFKTPIKITQKLIQITLKPVLFFFKPIRRFIYLTGLVILFIIFQNYQLELQKRTTTKNRGNSIPIDSNPNGINTAPDKKARTPKAMIVGAKSCGTAALQSYLSLHPYVALTAVKETHYYDNNLHRGEYWYKNEFSMTTPEQAGIDRTDTYAKADKLLFIYKFFKVIKLLKP